MIKTIGFMNHVFNSSKFNDPSLPIFSLLHGRNINVVLFNCLLKMLNEEIRFALRARLCKCFSVGTKGEKWDVFQQKPFPSFGENFSSRIASKALQFPKENYFQWEVGKANSSAETCRLLFLRTKHKLAPSVTGVVLPKIG